MCKQKEKQTDRQTDRHHGTSHTLGNSNLSNLWICSSLNDSRLSDRSREKSDKVFRNAFTNISAFFVLQYTHAYQHTAINTISKYTQSYLNTGTNIISKNKNIKNRETGLGTFIVYILAYIHWTRLLATVGINFWNGTMCLIFFLQIDKHLCVFVLFPL